MTRRHFATLALVTFTLAALPLGYALAALVAVVSGGTPPDLAALFD